MTGLLDVDSREVRLRAPSLAALVRAATAAAGAASSSDALRALAEAAHTISGAEIALVRALDDSGERLEAVAVAAPRALAAELYGTVLPAAELPETPLDDLARAPDAVRRIARHTGSTRLLLVPARADGCAVSIELLGSGEPFGAEQRLAVELCAAQAALVLRAFSAGGDASSLARPALELAGEALAVALEEEDAAAEVVRLAAGVVGASASVLWESRDDGLVPAASWGVDAAADLAAAREVAERALAEPGPVSAHAAGLPQDCAVSTTVPLGRPPLGVLQLFHPAGEEPEAEQLTRLATFGVRAAHALRTGERARLVALESTSAAEATGSSSRRRAAASPGPMRASPTVCSTSRSVPHGSERFSRWRTSRGTRGSQRPRQLPARAGSARRSPFRSWRAARSSVCSPPTRRACSQPASTRPRCWRRSQDSSQWRSRTHSSTSRLPASARSARLHSRVSGRRRGRSARSTRCREQLLPRAVHIRDAPFAAPVRTILTQPVAFGLRNVQRLFRERRAFRLGPGRSRGGQFLPALVPFLEKGWTAAVVPVALPTEVVASLEVFSFRPGDPVSQETVEAATALAGQAALAIDNARLYQQQKQFADTMQRSLLPRSRPVVEGLEVGEVYEPSARVDVGGDVYDFLALDDGRLAVVLGDVTGHGVDATADMAMAKFVFRSLAREHPEPADFLAAANDVICSEIASGKFISMSYVVVDGVSGRVSGASAGHPAPRIVLPGGSTRPLEAHGLVLGIDSGQEYAESHTELPAGASLVLYTDGIVEARRNGELYGDDRLDALLADRHDLPARALAAAVAEDAREFAGGDLSDDLAVVVIRRT